MVKNRKGKTISEDNKKEGSMKQKDYKLTSFKLNFNTIAGLKTILKYTKCSTAVSALQTSVEFYLQRLPELFPLVSAEDIKKQMEEELKKIQNPDTDEKL